MMDIIYNVTFLQIVRCNTLCPKYIFSLGMIYLVYIPMVYSLAYSYLSSICTAGYNAEHVLW